MHSPLRSLVRGWRAALLLAVVACASPQRAAAECGDYVTILNAPPDTTHHAMPPKGDQQDGAPARTPCRGPNCEGAPAKNLPPLAPAVPAGPQVKEHAQLLLPVGDCDRDPQTFDRDGSSPRPIRRATSVFHPPRLG